MATGTLTFAADFIEGAYEKVHNLGSDTIQIALSNTAPASESSNPLSSGNGILANVTQVAYTFYADDLTSDRVLESVTSNESGGTYTFDAADFQISASGGTLATWTYMYVFNQTATNDEIIGVFTSNSAIALTDTQTVDIAFNASGIFTDAVA